MGESAEVMSMAAGPSRSGAPNRTALVIEDSYATRRLVDVVLASDRFSVVESATGPDGLATALEIAPDIVILDIALPGMDGWEVLHRMRAEPSLERVPVVVITARDAAAMKQRPDVNLVDAIVAKPFKVDELRRIVERVLDARTAASAPP
jgi:CheY-like chemotaxis protein